MPDDLGQMRDYLKRLSIADLIAFHDQVWRRPLYVFREPRTSDKAELVELILSWRDCHAMDWRRACMAAGIPATFSCPHCEASLWSDFNRCPECGHEKE